MEHIDGYRFKCLLQNDTLGDFPGKYEVIYCKLHREECCTEGCCPLKFPQLYFHTWEILVVVMMMCFFASIFICVYCYRLCRFGNISVFGDNSIANIVSAMDQNGESSGCEYRTPPPAYDVAINLPPFDPDNKVPSYEEAVSRKLFSLK